MTSYKWGNSETPGGVFTIRSMILRVTSGRSGLFLFSSGFGMADDISFPYPIREARILAAIGDAVSRWANLEFCLVQIMASALRIDLGTSAALLSNVKTFSLMLDLTDTAVKCRLPDARELAFWNSLVGYIRELSGDRNYIAHNAVVPHGPELPKSPGPDYSKVTLKVGPNLLDSIASGRIRRHGVEALEIEELVMDFQQAIELCIDFNKALGASATSQDRFFSPISRRRPTRKQRQEAARKAPPPPPRS